MLEQYTVKRVVKWDDLIEYDSLFSDPTPNHRKHPWRKEQDRIRAKVRKQTAKWRTS